MDAKKAAAPRKSAGPKKAASELPNTNPDGTKPEGGEWSPFGRQEVAPPAPADLSALTPLDFLLQVMRDPEEDKGRRMSAAQLAAPYVHAKKGESSAKKDEAEARKKAASSGRFARRQPPALKVV
ncbi:MAG TPA: hypothetical protein VMS38_02245 [Pseudorhodoferax sp.]|nr:hypothetical protein [Pseudorhodoferax sp.]